MSDLTLKRDAVAEFEEAIGYALGLGVTYVELEEVLREAAKDA